MVSHRLLPDGRHRFVPEGYIDLDQAIVLAAKLRNPDRWRPTGMHATEIAIYSGLGTAYRTEFLGDYLAVQISEADRSANPMIMERLCDHRDASAEIRRALFSGRLKSEFIDDWGKFDFILKDGWGGDAGLAIMQCGVAWLDDGPDEVSRLVLLRTAELAAFVQSLPSTSGANPKRNQDRPGGDLPVGSRSRKDVARQKLLSLRAEGTMTLQQEVEAMKQAGFGRDLVRQLRRGLTNAPRGRRKKIGGRKIGGK